jgi:hypothetical protein
MNGRRQATETLGLAGTGEIFFVISAGSKFTF